MGLPAGGAGDGRRPGANLVAGVIRGSGQLRGGEPAQYGAVHGFTLDKGKITRFRREYVDLDQAL